MDKHNDDIEEDLAMESSTSSVTCQYQKELKNNKLLPYYDDLEAESQILLAEIKANLGRAILLREIQPGCSLWGNRLYKYIRIYGLKFTKEDHILFIKLMYELITIPNLEQILIYKFALTLTWLLKKEYLISQDELELPWRPLYKLTCNVKDSGKTFSGLHRYLSWLGNTLCSLVHAAKVYFPVSATQEVLDELRPMLCPLDKITVNANMEMLEWFLPVVVRPQYHSLGPELWFDEFMTFWEVCHNAQQWENNMMWLMARLAQRNIGYINWEPHLPIMFTRFIRCLGLPVLYNKMLKVRQHKMDVAPIAIWIVSVLGNGSKAQMYLEKFLKTIETYFHPANVGSWLGRLKELLIKLPYHFILRLNKERYGRSSWLTPIPNSHKLTDADIDAFVKSIMPIAMTAMFSKLGVNDACQALQHLASIRPNLVIPDVLERMYATIDSLTEPHKLTAAMIATLAVARPMVQGSRNINRDYAYAEGPTHVLPLLFSFLPGIDPNDTGKCLLTFRLISAYSTLVPIIDSSRSSAPMDDEDRMICEATSRFEDFIVQFLDKIFLFIDSSSLEFVRLESRVGNDKSKLESVAETALAAVCTSIMIQTSDEIFECALRKLRTLVTVRVLETKVAGQLAAVICGSFSRVNAKSTLRCLVPVLSQMILDITADEDDVLKEENLDNRLLFAMLLLSSVVDTVGCHLLPHMNTLMKVLDRVLLLKSREGHNLACKLLMTMLVSLSNALPYHFRMNGKDYNDPDYPYVRDWGQSVHVDSLTVEWYIPGKEEINVVRQIFLRYLLPEVTKLQQYCQDRSVFSREELLISLNIVNSILGGCETVLPLWKEEPLKLVNSSLSFVPFSPTLGSTETIEMPDGSNVRKYMVGIMQDVQKTILEHIEDDTKSLFVLIRIWSSLLLGRMRLRKIHELRRKNFEIIKKVLTDKLVGNKGLIGVSILEAADIQHQSRLFAHSVVLTETHKQIMLQLFTLAISRYAQVRCKAQDSLHSAQQYFPYAYTFFVPKIIETLQKDCEEYHEAHKGALYFLFGPQYDHIVVKPDWKTLKTLWPAIVMSKISGKQSVIQLKEIILDCIYRNFPTITITIEVPDECLSLASQFWETYPQPTLSHPTEDEIQKGIETLREVGESNLESYNALVDDLFNAMVNGNLHWRQKLMAMNFIRHLAHPDQMYPPKVVRFFLSGLINESLQERKISIITVILMLKQQKRKHKKITIDVPQSQDQSRDYSPGERLDNAWLQYDYETRPLTAEEWDKPRFVHKPYVGYYAWPKKLEVYAPSSEQPCLDPEIRQLTDSEKEVHAFFNDTQNIETLIKYFSLEEKKGKDKFNGYKYALFKGLFRNHGNVHLKHFLPHLYKLVTDKQQSNQMCAAEIIAGVIRGAKHWTFKMTNEMWTDLLPVIRLALANITVETAADWAVCFATAQQHRDPNRHHWFLECLMEEPPLGDSEASFIECGRLYSLQGALNQQSWRVSQLLQRLLTRLEDRLLMNPFENVRERLGSILVTVFFADLRFPNTSYDQLTPRVQYLIDKVIPRLQQLAEENSTIFCKEEQSLSVQVANVKFDDTTKDSTITTADREGAIRLLKTVCKWISDTINCSLHGVLPGFYQVYPIICQLENCEADEELERLCSSTLAVLAHALTLPCDMPIVLDAVTKMSRNLSMWARTSCIEFLQVLVFHNMSILLSNSSWVNCVRDIVLCLLEDERLEVREKTGHVLAGLLHCMFIPKQENLLKEFKRKALTKLHKIDRNSTNKEETDRSLKADTLRIRHAGVLGLCAFIQAHPYDVPKYVPPIFEHLRFHMHDPQPIPTTIRKTLADFKRTHYDGWNGINGHAQSFTEEQLAVLQDLTVPPAHYT